MTKEENEKRLEYLKGIVRRLPDKPGSYQFYDEEKTIIYVGKAKSLKNRVSSYFHTEVDRFKTKVLLVAVFGNGNLKPWADGHCLFTRWPGNK